MSKVVIIICVIILTGAGIAMNNTNNATAVNVAYVDSVARIAEAEADKTARIAEAEADKTARIAEAYTAIGVSKNIAAALIVISAIGIVGAYVLNQKPRIPDITGNEQHIHHREFRGKCIVRCRDNGLFYGLMDNEMYQITDYRGKK